MGVADHIHPINFTQSTEKAELFEIKLAIPYFRSVLVCTDGFSTGVASHIISKGFE